MSEETNRPVTAGELVVGSVEGTEVAAPVTVGNEATASTPEVGGEGVVTRAPVTAEIGHDANGSPVVEVVAATVVTNPPVTNPPAAKPALPPGLRQRYEQLVEHAAGAPNNVQYRQELDDLESRYEVPA